MLNLGQPIPKSSNAEYLAQCASRFGQAMLLEGLGNPPELIADGKVHRFYIDGDKVGSQNGWYVFYGTAGAYGSWRTGFQATWPRGERQNEGIKVNLQATISAVQTQQKIDRNTDQLATASVAKNRWSSSIAASADHPYLKAKSVAPYGLRQIKQQLQIPLFDFEGNLWNLQSINPVGAKFFLKGGRVKGLFSPIGSDFRMPVDTFVICEGWATGASIHQDMHYPVMCAMNAGNLLPVAEAARNHAPSATIIIIADNDRHTEGNPGVTKALEAARMIKAAVIIPQFPDGASGTDYNDRTNLKVCNA